MIHPSHAYVVCSTQRSGSTYLCRLLASTGVAGNPQEYFEARAETGSPPHPGYFLAGLPRTGAGIRDDVRPTDAPEYSDLRARRWVGGTPGPHVSAGNDRQRRVRSEADVEPAAGLGAACDRAAGVRRPGSGQSCWSGCLGIRATCGCGAATRCDRRSAYGARSRPALGARSIRRQTAERPTLSYSFRGIEHLRRRLSADDEAWGRFFLHSLIDPLELCTRTMSARIQRAPSRGCSR